MNPIVASWFDLDLSNLIFDKVMTWWTPLDDMQTCAEEGMGEVEVVEEGTRS